MFGVWLTREPYALIACAAWSSDMMKMMFGRLSVAARNREDNRREGRRARRLRMRER